ncbi:MAG: glycosyltransferase family 4 protein [Planctomycetes bacterium]|nr:glycosyltransferase family 4 protein [Planctomycetota bacterium]
MRILWVNHHAAPVGGAERYMRDAVPGLRDAGWDSHLLYRVDGALERGFVSAFAGAYPLVDLSAQVRALAADVVYVQQLPGLAEARLLAGLDVPVVRFHHDHELFCLRRHKYTTLGSRTCSRRTSVRACYPCLGFLGPGRGVLPVSFRRLGPLHAEQAANRRFAGHVVAAPYMREHLVLHDFPAERIRVLPPGVAPVEPRPRVEGGPVLYVGQLIRGKAVDVLLAAMTRLPGERLEIVGSGPQEGELRARCRALALDDRVAFLGRLDGPALEAAYRRAAVVAVPSRAPETLNLVGIEALARGVPVVATAVGGMGAWLQDGETGLAVPSNDAVALAAALRRLLTDSALRQRLADRGRAVVGERFTFQAHCAGLLAFFTSLLGRRA